MIRGKSNLHPLKWQLHAVGQQWYTRLFLFIYYDKLHRVSKKPDTPIMSHNSSKNQRLSMIFDKSNCPSTLDTVP